MNTYDPSKYIRGVKYGGDGGSSVSLNTNSNVDNEIKERMRKSQQVKNTAMPTSSINASTYNPNVVKQSNNLNFDPNFGSSISIQNNNNNFNNQSNMNNNNFQPSQIEEQNTIKVVNPYASIDFNSKSTNLNNVNSSKNIILT